MARPLRIERAGGRFHVTAHGNNKKDISWKRCGARRGGRAPGSGGASLGPVGGWVVLGTEAFARRVILQLNGGKPGSRKNSSNWENGTNGPKSSKLWSGRKGRSGRISRFVMAIGATRPTRTAWTNPSNYPRWPLPCRSARFMKE